jgi:enterochelin esterase-like enzyme
LLTRPFLFLAVAPLLAFTPVSVAQDTQLAIHKTQVVTLTSNESHSFFLSLQTQDFVQLYLDPHENQLLSILFDPSGARFRGAVAGPDPIDLNFIANCTGTYRIEITAQDKTATFAITLVNIVPVAAHIGPAKPLFESPHIERLRASFNSATPGAVQAFWDEIQKHGAPLIEPLPADSQKMLVTFLWRGTPDTHNVAVLRLPYAAGSPSDYFMDRLADTNIWYKTLAIPKNARFEYSLAPNVPTIHGISFGIDNDAIAMVVAAARPDPLNPNRRNVEKHPLNPPEYQGSSFVEMPDAPSQPWIMERPGIPAGQIDRHKFKSTLLDNEREIAAYLPPDYSKTNKPYPLLILFDEPDYVGDDNQFPGAPAPTILNNLIAARRIPPIVALFVGNAPGARARELPCNPTFYDFLVSELLPWAHAHYNFTDDSAQTIVAGSSFGGLAAACAALLRPATFGNVLSLSGSFWWTPPHTNSAASDSNTSSEPNWVAKQFIASPKLPLRFFLSAGSDEIDLTGGAGSILLNNRNLRDVLLAKGYEVHFQEFPGAHEFLSWRGVLADGLIALFQNNSGASDPPTANPR